MSKTPLKPEDLPRFAGQMCTAESPMFDLLPKGSTIVVGGNGAPKGNSYPAKCFLCGAYVWLDRRDDALLAGEKSLCILCPTCYFAMEPQEAQ